MDNHIISVINSHNFQRCINALWKGHFVIQYHRDNDQTAGSYKHLTSRRFSDHFDTQRISGIVLCPGFSNLFSPSLQEFIELVVYSGVIGFIYHLREFNVSPRQNWIIRGTSIFFRISFFL